MKKIIFRAVLCILIPILLVIFGYFGLSLYYQDTFSYGTWINDEYCTGKTIEEVNERLTRTYRVDPRLRITVADVDGGTFYFEELNMDEIGREVSYVNPLKKVKENQTSLQWGYGLFGGNEQILLPECHFDLELAKKAVEDLHFIKNASEDIRYDAEIIWTEENGYELVEPSLYILDVPKAKAAILEAIALGETSINLATVDYYKELPVTEETKNAKALFEKLQKFQSFSFSYQFGDEEEVVGPADVSKWILLDEEGNFVYDEAGEFVTDDEKIKEYITSLASKYDTFNGTRSFRATRGDLVTIEGGTYGNKLNQKKEAAYLIEAFQSRKEESGHIPEYEKQALYQGKNDIGTTYIEIDMTEQMMYYYEEGKLKLETPVVTGNEKRHMATPARTCFVYGKQRNRILKGPGYASFVNFWMPVNGGIGIHDAKWRKDFGGDIYKTDGSHGCINTPFDAMSKLYEMVEIGTPVVMFY